VTLNAHEPLLPLPSLAVQVTVVVPTLNALPLGGTQLAAGEPQLSLAVAVKVTLLEHVVPEVVTVMLAGQCTVGGSTSFTVTEKVQDETLAPSVALQVTTVTPRV